MPRFETPQGWTAQAYRFALDPTPGQRRAFLSHAGAARFAFNHMLALVTAVLDQRAAERSYGMCEEQLTPSQGWSLPALRRTWNQRKHEHAPWWAENSKEAYNTGLDGLARALDAWSKSRNGERAGQAVGFPRFKDKRARRSVRFTTGTIRVETDRHHVTLPRLGTIKTHETTRKLVRRIERGAASILSATLSEDSTGRWYVSFQTLVRRATVPGHGCAGHDVVGVDAGPRPSAGSAGRMRTRQRCAATCWPRPPPSGKTCSGCGSRKPKLTLAERTYVCEHCGLVIDRDLNAAINLARLGDTQHRGGTRIGTGSSPAADYRVGDGRGATQETASTLVVNAAGDEASTRHQQPLDQTGTASPEGEAA